MYSKTFQIIAVLLLLASFTIGQADQAKENLISRQLSEISKGVGSWARGAQIREELEKLRVRYSYIPFSATLRGATLNGWNIVADLPSPFATKTLMIGAHYDGEHEGDRSIISASGSVAILELLRAFKENPLKNYNLKVAFWDLEGHDSLGGIIAGFKNLKEKGLLGAKDYVESSSQNELPDIYINFDVFGYGDTFWLWAQDKNTNFASIFSKTAKDADMKITITSTKYLPGNYLAFAPKTESYSVGLSTMRDIQMFTKLLDISSLLEGKEAEGEEVEAEEFDDLLFDELFNDIGKDNMKRFYTRSMLKALPVIEKAIRNLDKSLR